MVKKVARQNNDLLKYHEKDYIIILNDDKLFLVCRYQVCILVAI